MEILVKIKDFVLKIWAWILHFFKRNKKHILNRKKKLVNVENKKIYKFIINRD